MRVVASRKQAISAVAVVALVAVAAAMIAYPASAISAEGYAVGDEDQWVIEDEYMQVDLANDVVVHTVSLKAKGWAFYRIDNETIMQCGAQIELTLQLGMKKPQAIPIVGVNGTVIVNGTSYAIESGQGLIGTKRHVGLIRCEGVDGSGNKITFKALARYFWWGGNLYAFRSRAILQTAEKPMSLLLRGLAKVQ